ncbi:MAG: HEAT repeat domain-containing protein [Candidatus Riflebacteria bacterium]|nr:HEAT repeat domain-containing protein [Candidatus Riflebacteria bacterium]
MLLDQLLKNPREAVHAPDGWTKRTALAAIAREPLPSDREIFEDMIDSDDTTQSLMAFLGLKKLFPAPAAVKSVWNEMFGESVDLLSRRACSGPAQLRIAALKALAFAPEHLSFGLVERVLESLDSPLTHENVHASQPPTLTLVQSPQSFFLPEGFAVLLASLPGGHNRVNLLRRELGSNDSMRLLPVLIALQLSPVAELTDQVLLLARSSDKRVALEAARALLACGGSKVYLVILSLLKEASDPQRKAWLLPLAASTGREETWAVIAAYAASEDSGLAQAALHAAESFPVPVELKAELYREAMRSEDPAVACLAAQLAWHSGSMKSLRLLERHISSDSRHHRAAAAAALGFISPETALPILAGRFDNEKSGDVIRQMILSLRRLLPKVRGNLRMHDLLMPWFARLLKSTDAFRRSQCAVLCGLIGRPAEDMVVHALEKEYHPHVIASLLSALGSCGCNRLLVYSRFHDHADSRVRANMISAMLVCGSEAVSYFSSALKDMAPRVRGAAAKNLFLLGQLDIVATLNRMLLVPEPLSVLSGCYALAQLLRIQPPMLSSDHPLPLAVARKTRMQIKTHQHGPALLNVPELAGIINEMAIVGGNRQKLIWLLEEKLRRFPASYPVRRMLASLLAIEGETERAAALIEVCLNENPGALADVLDAYRLALKLGNLDRATDYGERAKSLYAALLEGCVDLCRSLRGSGAELMMQKLHHLSEPSMNLYNAMIQLKVLENDSETVLDLMSELLLARPFNAMVVRKLAGMLPESFSELRSALEVYAASLPPNPEHF